MFDEKIPPIGILNEIIERKKIVEREYKEVQQRLAKAPSGTLVISWDGKRIQYFLKLKRGDKKRIYIRKGATDYIQQMAQKSYDKKMLPRLKYELTQLTRLENFYLQNDFAQIYSNMGKARKSYVTPLTFPDSMIIEKWKQEPYQTLQFKSENAVFISDNNEKLRSKSELILANYINKKNIPYKYEGAKEMEKKNEKIIVYPDFCCLNVKTRQEIYWEHFGMMDDPEYARKAIEKINLYTANGFIEGKNIIYTFETKDHPLTTESVEKIIQKYFLE